MAECVNGEVMDSRESLVTWALSAVAEAPRRGSGSMLLASFASADSVGGVVRAFWNCSIRDRVVVNVVDSCFDILRAVGWSLVVWGDCCRRKKFGLG